MVLLYCVQVPKVASTSLVEVMLRLARGGDGSSDDQLKSVGRGRSHVLLRSLLPPPTPSEDLSGFTSFMVVRHPFQRLLSAYRLYALLF